MVFSVDDYVKLSRFPRQAGVFGRAGSVVGQRRRRWASIKSASTGHLVLHTVTNTRRCIFVFSMFRVTCKPFLAGHCTMYVTEINKDIII